MVDGDNEESKKRAAKEFIKRLNELCNKVEKDYQELIKHNWSLEKILEEAEKCTFEHEIQWKSLENGLFIPYKLADRIDICRARQKFLLSDSGRGFTSIKIALKIIKNNTCHQCKKQLTKDNCYVYSPKTKTSIKWTIEQAQNFDGEDFRILFCSPSCFRQSPYQNQNESKKTTSSQTKPLQQSPSPQTQEPLYCAGHGCLKEIKKEYYHHKSKNDNNKFCSKECFTNYYGEFCYGCMNTFLREELYTPNANNPRYLLCLDCYEKEKQKERERETEKNKPVYCLYCSAQIDNHKFFKVCEKDDCKKEFWGIKEQRSNQYSSNLQEREREREQWQLQI